MARYTGGMQVAGGYYWSPGRFTLVPVAEEGAVLPGDASRRYLRVHWAVALLLAPVVGGLYVVCLPFVGLALMLQWAFARALGGARSSATDLAATVAPGSRPGEAHLTGRAGEPPKGDVAAGGAGEKALEDVAHEIARKRAQEGSRED